MGLWQRTLVLGLGFFAISAVWPLYDFYMPLYYAEYIGSGFLVGALMAIDNVLGLTLQPYVGALSDRTHTRYGRRIPYLLAGAPLAALFLTLVPFARFQGLLLLLLAALGLNLAMAMFRSPTVALMPDLVPAEKRSTANGIINFMGGLGAGVPLLIGGWLYLRHFSYPFLLSAGLLLLVTAVFWAWIREPAVAAAPVAETPLVLRTAARSLLRGRDAQTLLMMATVLLWSMAFQATSTWFSTYATGALHFSAQQAAQTMSLFPYTIVALAIPAGLAGSYLGRRRSILLGALVMAAGLATLVVLPEAMVLRLALIIAGAGHSLIVVNAYPALVEMAGPGETGTYTGLYYIASQVGAILSPPLMGIVKDVAGWGALFVIAVLLLVGCAACVSRVWRADVQPATGAERKSRWG